jgi:hypothetical protein
VPACPLATPASTSPCSPTTPPAAGALLPRLIEELAQLRCQLAAAAGGEQPWEYLTLYAACSGADRRFYIQGPQRRGTRLEEGEALRQLGAVGWQLVAVVPACQDYEGGTFDHQLYLKRPGPTEGPHR